MNALEKRLVVLEQAAKALAALTKQHVSRASIEKMEMEIKEILSRPPSTKTQEEQIADIKANLARMDTDWKLRYEHT